MAQERYSATGRRKSSIARVALVPGTGKVIINKRPMDEYFGRETSKMVVSQPIELVQLTGKGRRAVRDIMKVRNAIVAGFFGELTEEEAGRAVALLEKALAGETA